MNNHYIYITNQGNISQFKNIKHSDYEQLHSKKRRTNKQIS